MQHARRFVALVALLLVAGRSPADGLPPDPDRPAARFVPAGVDAVILVREGDHRVQAIRGLLAEHGFAQTPIAGRLLDNPELLQGRIFLNGIAEAAGTDAWTAVGAVLGRDLVIGLRAGDDGRLHYLAASVPRDAALADRVLRKVYTATGLMRDGQPDPDRHRRVGGNSFYKLDNGVIHGRIGPALVLSDDKDLVREAVEAQREPERRLSMSPRYRAAVHRLPADASIGAFGDAALLRRLLEKEGREHVAEALPAVLLAAWWNALQRSEDVVLGVTPAGRTLTVTAIVDTPDPLPPVYGGFLPGPTPAAGTEPGSGPDMLARLSVRRDWEALFAERESIMALPAASDFVNFANTLTTLLGQVDFVDEVLAQVNGPVTLVAARQEFPPDRVPAPQLPAFALVIPLDFPDGSNLRDRLHSGALSAFAILNVDAARNDRPTFLLDVEHHRDHRIVTARYPEPRGGAATPAPGGMADDMQMAGAGNVDQVYNFAPAAVVVDRHYIVATSPALLRQVIDGLDTPAPATAVTDRLLVRGAGAVDLLRANREALVVNSMLEDDKSRAAAEGEIDTLLGLLDYAETLELTTRAEASGHTASLTLTVRPPRPPAP